MGLLRASTSPRIPGAGAPATTAPPLAWGQAHHTSLPARPFAVAAPRDGERAFVSMPRAGSTGLAVLSAGEPWRLDHVLWTPDTVPRGMAVTGDGRHLLIANGAGGLLIADTARLAAGDQDPFVVRLPSPDANSMQVALDAEERIALVTDEDSATLSVFDFDGSLRSLSDAPAARLVGQVPLPPGPVGVALSPDGATVYVTSQGGGRKDTGVISVLSHADVVADPAKARVESVPAGASPVRVAVSPSGEVVWVTARASNALLGFDAAQLASGGKHARRALRAVVGVGAMPVGVTTAGGGATVVVANSNRYGADSEQPQTLSLIDATTALAGKPALTGTLPTGAFPRELATLADDRTVLVTNVFTQSLQAIRVVP